MKDDTYHYHITYMIVNKSADEDIVIGDFVMHYPYEITNTAFQDFRTCLAAELECPLTSLVVLNYFEIPD